MKTTSSSFIKWIGAAVFVLFILSVVYLPHLYASLTLAFILAYLLDPIVEKLDQWKISRHWGALLTLLLAFLLLTLMAILIIPKIIAQGQELLIRLPLFYSKLTDALAPLSRQYLGYNIFEDFDQAISALGDPTQLVRPLGNIAQTVFSTTFRVVSTVLGFLIIPLLAYHLLRDYPKLYGKFLHLLPKRHHKTAQELRARLHVVFGGFIRGQLVVSSILAFYYCIAFSILKLELALVLGLMAGLFNIVPYLGILSVLALTLLTAAVHGAALSLLVAIAIIFAIGMALEGSLLTPKIVGSKVGLSPLTLIVALLAGGELLGLVGMLLAIPIAAISKVFLDYGIERYRQSDVFTKP